MFKENTEGHRGQYDSLSAKIIGAAIEAHKILGPGLLESTYEKCLTHELNIRGLTFKTQAMLPVKYKGIKLDCGYRVDLLVEDSLIVELKSIQNFSPIHTAQLLTYMRLANINTGLLVNFNVQQLKYGIKRFKI